MKRAHGGVGCRLLIAVAACVSLAFTLAGAASATHHLPRQEQTPQGNTAAVAALLATPNLGRAWFADPPPNPLHIVSACTGSLDPDEADLVEVGTSSAFFNNGPNVLMQTVSVFGSRFDAQAAWSRTIAASPLDCMRVTLAHDRITPGRSARIPSPPGVTAYRVVGHFEARGRKLFLYFDQLLLHRGRMTTRVFLTSYTHPFRRSFETRLERALVQRLDMREAGNGLAA